MNKIWLGFFIIKLKHMASWHETELYLKNSCKYYPEKLEICPFLGTNCINKLSWFLEVASNRNFNFWLIGTSKVFIVQLLFNFGLPVSNVGFCCYISSSFIIPFLQANVIVYFPIFTLFTLQLKLIAVRPMSFMNKQIFQQGKNEITLWMAT